jgi:hypothetical protein
MVYYNGSLYLFAGSTIFEYDLNSESWSKIETSNKAIDKIVSSAQCLYEDKLYTVKGWDYKTNIYNPSIYVMNLSSDEYEINKI